VVGWGSAGRRCMGTVDLLVVASAGSVTGAPHAALP
jgi:hypothetical protein